MKILASMKGDNWAAQREFARPFGIDLGSQGAVAAEAYFTVYFKSGRDTDINDQQADIVLLETNIIGDHHNLILELTRGEAVVLRAKANRINKIREEMDEATQLDDFAEGDLIKYINENI